MKRGDVSAIRSVLSAALMFAPPDVAACQGGFSCVPGWTGHDVLKESFER